MCFGPNSSRKLDVFFIIYLDKILGFSENLGQGMMMPPNGLSLSQWEISDFLGVDNSGNREYFLDLGQIAVPLTSML